MRLYIGTYTDSGSQGIYTMERDSFALAAVMESPSYVISGWDGRKLYAVSETQSYRGLNGGAVAAFDFDTDGSGRLKMTGILPTYGRDPCHLCVSRKLGLLFAANYSEGTFCQYDLDGHGDFTGGFHVVGHSGSGQLHPRQDSPHIHFVSICPWRHDLLWTIDLGLDMISCYRVSPGVQPVLEGGVSVPAGYGPRHATFHPTLPIAYVVCELANRLLVIDVSPLGMPERIAADISTVPDGVAGNLAAAVKCCNDGHTLYISNRGHNSVASFTLGPDGMPVGRKIFQCGGKEPRDIALSPDNRWLICANQGGDVTALQVGEDGELGFPHRVPSPNNPVCLCFADEGSSDIG